MNNKFFTVSSDGVFYSLQGEGITMGAPSVFLRLYGCNLSCIWCDTPYAWTNTINKTIKHWSLDKTVYKIKNSWLCQNTKIQKRLVVTGGEPLLQQKLLSVLVTRLPNWVIEIETNGTIVPEEKLIKYCQFNCSPKTRNSRNSRTKRLNPRAIKTLRQANTIFKFVAENKKDITKFENDYITPFNIDPNQVIIMPQGKTRNQIIKIARSIVKIVNIKGYRLLLRLHIDLWGKKKRV